jgi:phage shock protein A
LNFFETITTLVKATFTKANHELEDWLKSLMDPIESQAHEHAGRLRRRHDSIKRIYEASHELEQRISDLQTAQDEIDAMAAEHDAVAEHLRESINEFFDSMDSPISLRQFQAA